MTWVPRIHSDFRPRAAIDAGIPVTPSLLAVLLGYPGTLTSRELGTLRRLQIAAAMDRHGVRKLELSSRLYYDPRTVQTDRRVGRALWHDLGAWPWALFPAGQLPDDWRDHPEAGAVLFAWAFG